VNLTEKWISLLRRRCFPPWEGPGRPGDGEREALKLFRELGKDRLSSLSWEETEEILSRARILLVGSWHHLLLHARFAGALAARFARKGEEVHLGLGMIPQEALRTKRIPRGLPESFLDALFQGLGEEGDGVEVRGWKKWNRGLAAPGPMAERLVKLAERGKKVILLHGEFHLLPPFLPRALKESALGSREKEFRVLWPGAPGPFLHLASRGGEKLPALLGDGSVYLPLCHPLHRIAALEAWREKSPLLPATPLHPLLPPGPTLEEAFHDLAGRCARFLEIPLPSPIPLVTFEADNPYALVDSALDPGPARDLAHRALEEGEGLALPHLPMVVLGGPGALEAAEEAAHFLHISSTGLHRVPHASPLHGMLLGALAEAVARGTARAVLPGTQPWRPRTKLLPQKALAWKRRAWPRIRKGGAHLPSLEWLDPTERGVAAHLIGYSLAETILESPGARERLQVLARTPPPSGEEECLALFREVLP